MQVPFQFLGKEKTGLERIAHDHVDAHHRNKTEGNPHIAAPDPLVEGVDPFGYGLKKLNRPFKNKNPEKSEYMKDLSDPPSEAVGRTGAL